MEPGPRAPASFWPSCPAIWARGYHRSAHTYFPAERALEVARTFREREIPCDALYLDISHPDGYRPFPWKGMLFPDSVGMIRQLHEQLYRVSTIMDPGIEVGDYFPVFRERRE